MGFCLFLCVFVCKWELPALLRFRALVILGFSFFSSLPSTKGNETVSSFQLPGTGTTNC